VFRVRYIFAPLQIFLILSISFRVKFFAVSLMLNPRIPKYTASAPALIAALRLRKSPAGASSS